jgi:hypothetical protein
MRFFKVIVRPDPAQAGRAQGYIQAMDEATARAMLPQIDGLMLFDQSQKMRPGGFRESWTAGAHVIEQARKAQGLGS